MGQLDDTKAHKITDDIWWIGFADFEAGFSNNPYILIDEDEAILFDPGPGHPVFRDMILQKIEQVINPEKIKYIVVHHPDPDLCGLIPYIENILNPNLIIIAHPRTSLFIPYYGIRKSILSVGDEDVLELKSGRKIKFIHTPYIHFAGSMVTYDEKTGSLYSSDIFAAFDREWKLYADESYIELARSFIKSYVWGREPLKYAYDKFKKLKIDYIFPQHGGIIKENVDKFLNILKDTIPGQLLEELKNKPSFEQEQKLFETGKNWLEGWLNNKINAYTLDDLLKISIKQGPSTVAILIDNLIVKSKELGIANPLTYGHLHKWNNLNTSYTEQLISSIRKRFLSRLYGMSSGKDTFYEVIKEGLLSFKTDLNIMFVDIRGFTKWSKDKTPGEIVGILNKQIESISKIIHSNGGFVNKIIGDGILAYFPENKSSLCNLTSIEKIIVKIKPEDPETAGFKFKPDLNIMEIK